MKQDTPESIERRRGHTDALAGHGPALYDGPYMIGYRRGRQEIGNPMEYLPPTWSKGASSSGETSASIEKAPEDQ